MVRMTTCSPYMFIFRVSVKNDRQGHISLGSREHMLESKATILIHLCTH